MKLLKNIIYTLLFFSLFSSCVTYKANSNRVSNLDYNQRTEVNGATLQKTLTPVGKASFVLGAAAGGAAGYFGTQNSPLFVSYENGQQKNNAVGGAIVGSLIGITTTYFINKAQGWGKIRNPKSPQEWVRVANPRYKVLRADNSSNFTLMHSSVEKNFLVKNVQDIKDFSTVFGLDGRYGSNVCNQSVSVLNTNVYWNTNFKVVSSLNFKDFKITLEKKVDFGDCRINPDGTPFYRTTLGVGIIRNGEKRISIIESDIYTQTSYTTSMLPCLLFDSKENKISVFSSSKASDSMYGMDGLLYSIDLTNNKWTRDVVFTNSNWGWYSFFGGSDEGKPQLWHFSFAGYHAMQSQKINSNWKNENIGSLTPDCANKQYYLHANTLYATTANVDRMLLSKEFCDNNYQANTFKSEKPIKKAADFSWSDLAAIALNAKNLWDIGEAVFSEDSDLSISDVLTNLVKCLIQDEASNLSSDPRMSAIITESINTVSKQKGVNLDPKNLDLKGIAIGTLQGYVIQDLEKRGHTDTANLLKATSFLNCLTSK